MQRKKTSKTPRKLDVILIPRSCHVDCLLKLRSGEQLTIETEQENPFQFRQL